MNIFDELKNKKIKLLKQLGIVIEDRDYDLKELTDIYIKVNNYTWGHRTDFSEKDLKPYKELDRVTNKIMYSQWLKESSIKLENSLSEATRPGKEKYKWMERWMDSTAYDSGVWPAKKTKVEDYKAGGKEIISCILTLGRKYTYGQGEGHIPYPLDKRVGAFYVFLENSLLSSEQLICRNKSFCITAPSYEINYYIEAYRKETNKRCYIEDIKQKLVIEKLDRPGVGKAFYELKSITKRDKEAIEEVFRSMQNEQFIVRYPNAADRFVFLCERRISQELGE